MPIVAFEDINEKYPSDEYEIMIAIGNSKMNDIRKEIFYRCKERGYDIASYYHSSCSIHSNTIGEGNIFLENCLIYPFSEIGDGNLLWDHVSILYNCAVGSFNTFSSYASLCASAKIGNNGFYGSYCIVDEHLTTADYTLVEGDVTVKN